ncbi:MAG: DUF3805 domain-containing protein [Leptospira sp.]|nr:DUF3805 domain-containing protein [Leptospira sp.]
MSMKLDYQPYKSPFGWYSLVYPEYWEMEVIEDIPAFFDPEGSGALQISAFENLEGDYNLTEEMIRYLAHHKIQYDEEHVANFKNEEGTVIKACEFNSKGRFWIVYMLSYKSRLILCTYNSDETPDKELSEILTIIISSIRFFKEE